ncbi:MAG: hypothetical protein GX868_09500, partial [Actinobacteria bacterium]|nr:hypothetical protein [Actinomycetota bacterium]
MDGLEGLVAGLKSGATTLARVESLLLGVRLVEIWPGERGAAVAVGLHRTGTECGTLSARCRSLADDVKRQAEQQRRAAQCDEPGVAVGGGRPIAPIRPPWADRSPLAAIDRDPPVSERIAAALAAASVEEIAEEAAEGAAEGAANHPRVAVLEGLLKGRWAGTSPLD